MLAPRILIRYFAKRLAKTAIGIFFGGLILIGVIDYLEVTRRTVFAEDFDAAKLALLTLLRVPVNGEAFLPFAMLYGAITAFAVSNRNLEFVVARAAGVSAWQFLLPGAAVGFLIGIVSITVFNPLAATMLEQSFRIAAGDEVAAATDSGGGRAWVRQDGRDGESILTAAQSFERGTELAGVTAFLFDRNGTFRERIDAKTARLEGNEWILEAARITSPQSRPRVEAAYRLHTYLTADQAGETLADPKTVSFWSLPTLISLAERASVPANRLKMQYHTLLARPLLLLAMVLIAAIVSLRFTRSGHVGRMILAGVTIGFVLYVVVEIAGDLGESGLVPPIVAAWLPAITATIASVTVLLFQEDG